MSNWVQCASVVCALRVFLASVYVYQADPACDVWLSCFQPELWKFVLTSSNSECISIRFLLSRFFVAILFHNQFWLLLLGLHWFGVQVWAGNPAKFLRHLTEEEHSFIALSATNYAALADIHAKENLKTFEEIEADKLTRKKWAQQSDDYDSHLGIRREKPPQLAFPDKMASKGPHWFLF